MPRPSGPGSCRPGCRSTRVRAVVVEKAQGAAEAVGGPSTTCVAAAGHGGGSAPHGFGRGGRSGGQVSRPYALDPPDSPTAVRSPWLSVGHHAQVPTAEVRPAVHHHAQVPPRFHSWPPTPSSGSIRCSRAACGPVRCGRGDPPAAGFCTGPHPVVPELTAHVRRAAQSSAPCLLDRHGEQRPVGRLHGASEATRPAPLRSVIGMRSDRSGVTFSKRSTPSHPEWLKDWAGVAQELRSSGSCSSSPRIRSP